MESEDGSSRKRSAAIVIGTGSTAKTAIELLQKEGIIVTVTGPDEKQAQQMAELMQTRVVPMQSMYDMHSDLVVLTDPDIKAGPGRQQVNPSYFRPGTAIIDLCNIPLEHELTAEARERGCDVLAPRKIWEAQIKAQFKTFTGESLPE